MKTGFVKNTINEINTDWIGGYSAKEDGGKIKVLLNEEVVAEVNEDYKVSGSDESAVKQLEFMVNR